MNRKLKLLLLSSLLTLTCGVTSCSKGSTSSLESSLNSVSESSSVSSSASSEIQKADSIKVKTAPKESVVGTTLNLDDYVTVIVAGKEGGKYIATSKKENVAIILEDGKTLSFVGTGSFLIEITDESGSKNQYFSGKVTSSATKEIEELVKKIKNNYTIYSYDANIKGITTSFPAYHTDSYYCYPYGFYYGKYEDKNTVYRGILQFTNDEMYTYQTGYLEEGYLLDTSTMTLGDLLRGEPSNYLGFSEFDSTILNKFTSQKNEQGVEYLVATFDEDISNLFFQQTMGIYINYKYCDSIALQAGSFQGKQSLYVSCLKNGEVINQYVITDIGITSYQPMEDYIKDLSHCKPKIDYSLFEDAIKEIVRTGNYTATSETYLADDTYGNKISIADAVAMYEPLHNMYSIGTSKFTEEGMLIVNKGPSDDDIENYTGIKAFGCIEQDSRVYTVEYDSQEKKYVVTDEIKDPKGNSYREYEDYFDGLGSVNIETLSEFIFLAYYESNQLYSFTIGKDSKNGSDNLRALTMFINPTVANLMFPIDLDDNQFEAGSAGEGLIKINEDGGFTFYYYTSRVSTDASGKNLEFRICMEYTITDIGTTTISEYEGL